MLRPPKTSCQKRHVSQGQRARGIGDTQEQYPPEVLHERGQQLALSLSEVVLQQREPYLLEREEHDGGPKQDLEAVPVGLVDLKREPEEQLVEDGAHRREGNPV